MQASGEFYANGEIAMLHDDGAFHRLIDPDTLLGSSLTMLQGIKNLVSWEVPIESAIQMATANPARIYDFEMMGRMTPGYQANVVVFDSSFNVKGLFIRGELIRDRF